MKPFGPPTKAHRQPFKLDRTTGQTWWLDRQNWIRHPSHRSLPSDTYEIEVVLTDNGWSSSATAPSPDKTDKRQDPMGSHELTQAHPL